jgi:hypothetical protein
MTSSKKKKGSTLQITTAVDTLVAEYKFFLDELLLNKKTIFNIEHERQEYSQSVPQFIYQYWYLPTLFVTSTIRDEVFTLCD